MTSRPPRAPGALPAGLGREELSAAVGAALDGRLAEGARAGLAVSGGPDSVALALLVRTARADLDLTVLHVRHGLRDDAADAEAAAAVARHLGLRCAVREVRVAVDGAGPEAAARAARLTALRDLATELDLAAVLLGHTAEDRAETVLLNLVRGSGLQGLAGMQPARTVGGLLLLRPLLDLRRDDVRAVPAAAGVAVVHDPTNRDPDQRRARARHEVLPALARLAGGPGDPVGALTRLAALAAADDALLDEQATEAARGIVHALGAARLLTAPVLDDLPPALARRVARRVLAEVRSSSEGLSARDVEVVLDLAEGRREVVGGIVVERSRGWVVLRPREAEELPERVLPTAGSVALPELGAALRVDRVVGEGGVGATAGPAGTEGPPAPWLPWDQWVAVSAAPAGWRVRGARPGDEIAVGGRRRGLAEVQRAAGVPRSLRRLLPVVTDARGEVLWAPGVAAADALADGPFALRVVGGGGVVPLGYPPRGGAGIAGGATD